MSIVYRTSGAWGPGTSADLSPAQVDNNFWQLFQDVQAKAVQGVGISNFTVTGNQMYVVLTDHTLLGPYTLPTVQLTFKGDWQPSYSYNANDIITHGGSTYLVLVNHVSAATFDPNASIGGKQLYGLLLQNPACILPAGGATGTFLRKIAIGDYLTAWETAALHDLSDVVISSPASSQILIYSGGHWINAAMPTQAISLDGLTDVTISAPTVNQVVTWNGSLWVNAAPHLSAITSAVITSPQAGQPLVYDGANWVNKNAVDPPVNNLGSISGFYNLDLSNNAATQLQMTGNLSIGSFLWVAASAGQFLHRVVEIRNTGNFTLGWPTAMKWAGGVIPTQTLNGLDVYVIHTFDGGTTVYGSVIGQGYV